ncbi:PREDICTED: U-box domain-containing protein 37 isoform X2 [Tarenaya hassleriana]|uniref:U-box domain-containing protein 37 isoform X2 n=1 Tax=Tarenaya hassleriana TaxID=28532 RepID=UPI00053C50CE|nr:PREDICTED: U-box domain-containing protein 37 isoform X2 [Tarenaya hassleriana]
MPVTVAMVSQVPDMEAKGLVPDTIHASNTVMSVADKPVSSGLMEDKIYVAVGRDVESKSTLIWALQNTGGKEFCIFYLHEMLHFSTSMKLRDEHRNERQKAERFLDKYLNISRQMGVRAEKLYMETTSIEKGIVEVISQQRVRKLVMGAASDRNYSMRMRDVKSRKAIFVRQHAPPTCHIWFTCNGYLICTREAVMDNIYLEYASPHQSVERHVSRVQSTSSGQDSVSRQSGITTGSERAPSFPEGAKDEAGYDQIRVALAEAEKSKQEAVLEANRRQKAEKDAIDATTRAKRLEREYSEELKRRKEAEIEAGKAKAELGKIRSFFDNRIAESERRASKLQHQYNLAVRALQRFMKERDELQAELNKAEGLTRRNRAEPPQCFFCPILKEIMEDPQVAADGFTYEAEAIRQWLERGHDTSPMTNTRLPHTGLVPNLALRSAIQEWLQLRQTKEVISQT